MNAWQALTSGNRFVVPTGGNLTKEHHSFHFEGSRKAPKSAEPPPGIENELLSSFLLIRQDPNRRMWLFIYSGWMSPKWTPAWPAFKLTDLCSLQFTYLKVSGWGRWINDRYLNRFRYRKSFLHLHSAGAYKMYRYTATFWANYLSLWRHSIFTRRRDFWSNFWAKNWNSRFSRGDGKQNPSFEARNRKNRQELVHSLLHKPFFKPFE